MARRTHGPDQTWREARGDFNVHLDSGKRVKHDRARIDGDPWVEHHAVCGFWFNGVKAARRITSDISLVSCKHCRKKPPYTCRVLLLDADVRADAGVLLDWIAEHPGDLHADPKAGLVTTPADFLLRPLVVRLRARRFAVEWLLQSDALKALFEAEALVKRLGQGACDAVVRCGDLGALRVPQLPLPGVCANVPRSACVDAYLRHHT